MIPIPCLKRSDVALATPFLTSGLEERKWPETIGSQKTGHG